MGDATPALNALQAEYIASADPCYTARVSRTHVVSHLPAQSLLRSWLFPLACFLGLSAALYGNSLNGSFVYDDLVYVQHGALRDPRSLLTLWLGNPMGVHHYRPITFVSFALNFLITGELPFWFHAVNVVLNGLASWLLFFLTLRLFRDHRLAWCTAILFAVLPIHTEAVAYIKARDEILVALFGFLAWLAFLRATEGSGRRVVWSCLAAALTLCTLLSKESGLAFPVLFLIVLLVRKGARHTMSQWFVLLLQAVAIAAYLWLHSIAMGGIGSPDAERLYFGQNPLGFLGEEYIPWTAAMLLFVAVGKTIVPWNLSATYGYAHLPPVSSPFDSWMVLAGVAVLLLLLACTLLPRVRRLPLGIGAFIFLVLYFPFSKIPVVRGIDFFGERWLYGPSAGLCLAATALFLLFERAHRNAAMVFGVAVLLTYSGVVIARNQVWSDQVALGESMMRSAPQSVVSYDFLARERLQWGMVDQARGLVTMGMRITDRHLPLHQVAALVALDSGDIPTAERAITKAEELGRHELPTVILRATLLATQRKFQESLDHLVLCKTLDYSDYRIRFLLALNYWKLGRFAEAEQYLDWDSNNLAGMLPQEQKLLLLESF